MYTTKELIMKSIFLLIFTSYYPLSFSNASSSNKKIGINYCQVDTNLSSPYQSIQLIQSTKPDHVTLYDDADPEIRNPLPNTNIHVSIIMIPNEKISTVASNDSQADQWVHENILAYLPRTKIRFILVGNEVFSSNDELMWQDLIQATRRIKRSLHANNIHSIKVGTALAMDAFETTFVPSSAKFGLHIPTLILAMILRILSGLLVMHLVSHSDHRSA